jgi:hypothetical protein
MVRTIQTRSWASMWVTLWLCFHMVHCHVTPRIRCSCCSRSCYTFLYFTCLCCTLVLHKFVYHIDMLHVHVMHVYNTRSCCTRSCCQSNWITEYVCDIVNDDKYVDGLASFVVLQRSVCIGCFRSTRTKQGSIWLTVSLPATSMVSSIYSTRTVTST